MSSKKTERKSNPQSAADVLQALLSDVQSPLSDEFTRWRMWRHWAEIVGENLAQNTTPVGLRNGTLYIWTKSAAWMQQLFFMAHPIKVRVNRYIGTDKIKDVRFTLDRKEVPLSQEGDQDWQDFLSNKPRNEGEEPPHGR